ncbi:MAG: hypothetical protein ACO1N0_16770 [Fluviicola sp.]
MNCEIDCMDGVALAVHFFTADAQILSALTSRAHLFYLVVSIKKRDDRQGLLIGVAVGERR